MVHRLILSYRGTAYAGWQRQANALAVQQVVEEALGDLLGQQVRLIGAGRTDAGVHARGQAAHFVAEHRLPPRALVRALVHGGNQRLPEDIRILAAHRMPEDFHALRCASGKWYRYRLSRAEVVSPLDSLFVVPLHRRVETALLAAAAQALTGRHDFSAFAAAGGTHGHPVRRIFAAEWREQGEELVFTIHGEGFLRGMVRALVGTMIEVGAGRRSLETFRELLAGRPRSQAGPTAPAHGLTLEAVDYPPRWSPLECGNLAPPS